MPLPFKQSIKHIGPDRWHVGSLVFERIKNMPSEDAIAAWAEDDCTYILRMLKGGDIASPPFTEASDGRCSTSGVRRRNLIGGLDNWQTGLLQSKRMGRFGR